MEYEQLNRALANDWCLRTEIAGNRNSVTVARRVLLFLVGLIHESAFDDDDDCFRPRRVNLQINDIHETLDISRATANRALKRLESNGQIRRLYTGHYELRLFQINPEPQ